MYISSLLQHLDNRLKESQREYYHLLEAHVDGPNQVLAVQQMVELSYLIDMYQDRIENLKKVLK